MKVLLIVPTFHYREAYPVFLSFSDFPSGLGYIASALKEARHEVHGLNLNNIIGYKSAHHMITDQIDKAIQEVKPDLIGMGGICTDYHFLRDAIEIIRTLDRTIPIALGGGIINNDAEYIFNLLKPDYAVRGEGEEGMVRIANGEISKGVIESVAQEPDRLPLPDYDIFGIKEMMDNFSGATRLLYRYSRQHPRPFTIVTARSCPFSCTFCVHNRGPKYRARSIENIINEIKVTYDKYHYNILLMLDELFAVNNKRMRDFCLELLKAKEEYKWDFDWTFQTHASAALDKDTLALAKEAGCFFFSYGLESASPTVLKSMNKKSKVEQIIEAIKLAEEAKIGFGGNLIFGDPAETDDTMAESLAFWFQHCRSAFVFMDYIRPYPGSKIFDYCLEKGIIKDKRQYYENIDIGAKNMTSMSNTDLNHRLQGTNLLEHTWLFTKSATDVKKELDPEENYLTKYSGQKMYRVTARCPYCKEETSYREMMQPVMNDSSFLGTGCVKCNRKIRVDIKAG